MKNAKNILKDYAWEIHALGDAEGRKLSAQKGSDHSVGIDVAIGMFCNNLDDVGVKDDPHKYDGIDLDWAAIDAEYGWNLLSPDEKAAIRHKHDLANDKFRGEIGRAYVRGDRAELARLYGLAYSKLG